MKIPIYICIVMISVTLFSQKKDTINYSDYILIKKGDSLININLEEVLLFPKHKFKSQKDARYYYWFRQKVFKAYPYAMTASERLDTLKVRLQRIKSRRSRKKYTKQAQKYLEGEFTAQLKKMTRTEGRILVKLIYRQTGKTVFQNIKELRSGWKAFWYNITANIFKLSLKTKYHPKNSNEDYLIEDILQRAFINGKLKEQIPKLQINSEEVIINKNGEINVEEYKKMFAKARKKRKIKKTP